MPAKNRRSNSNPANVAAVLDIDGGALDAYMADVYGDDNLHRIAKFLLSHDLTVEECIEFIRSKHLRWADDSFGRGIGRKADSAAVRRYVEKKLADRPDWLKVEARALVAGA